SHREGRPHAAVPRYRSASLAESACAAWILLLCVHAARQTGVWPAREPTRAARTESVEERSPDSCRDVAAGEFLPADRAKADVLHRSPPAQFRCGDRNPEAAHGVRAAGPAWWLLRP